MRIVWVFGDFRPRLRLTNSLAPSMLQSGRLRLPLDQLAETCSLCFPRLRQLAGAEQAFGLEIVADAAVGVGVGLLIGDATVVGQYSIASVAVPMVAFHAYVSLDSTRPFVVPVPPTVPA